MPKSLVILSVPFTRIGRVLLGSSVLEEIKANCDLLARNSHVLYIAGQPHFY